MRGHHYHNKGSEGLAYVRDTLIKNLREAKIKLMDKDGKPEELTPKEMGIGYPAVVSTGGKIVDEEVSNPNFDTKASIEGSDQVKAVKLKRFDFVLQFAWQPTPRSKRIELREKAAGQQAPSLAETPAGGP